MGRRDASQVGDELCGIKIIAADVRDSGVWSCCLDYGDNVGCSAQGEYWLSVKEYPLVIHPIPKIRVLSRWETNGQQRSQYTILTQAMSPSFWYANENKNNAGIFVVMGWIILAIYTI